MPATRSSARQSSDNAAATSSPASAKSTGGTKRKADDASSPTAKAKRGRPSKAAAAAAGGEKQQKTLEETVANGNNGVEATAGEKEVKDVEMQEGKEEDVGKANGHADESTATNGDSNAEKTNGTVAEEKTEVQEETKSALDQVKADEGDKGTTSKVDDKTEKTDAPVKEDAIEEDKKREEALPSNVLEKGIIYFFTRGRVNVDEPDSVQDLARSYFVMRPLPDGAKITDGAIQDLENNRLVALPKKVWPKSGKDRFMMFVEKAKASSQVLKDEFYSGSEYSTQTVGTRQTPEVTPLGEGVYAITSTGGGQGTSHLVYMLTIPETPGEVQSDVGLKAKGSFVLSLKNPEASGPANAQLPQGPDYPREFIDEFRGRGWMPALPKHLDYANAQMLLIGEDFEASNNLEATAKDEKDDAKVSPAEALETLEKEDELRVEHLRGDDTIFADLGISSKEYPKVKTTW